MEEIILLLLQKMKRGENPEFVNEKQTEGGLFVTDNNLVIYAQAKSPEEMPHHLKTFRELGTNIEYFTRLGLSQEGRDASTLKIDDVLYKGKEHRPTHHSIVEFSHQYLVKGIRRVTEVEYSEIAKSMYRSLENHSDKLLERGGE